MKYTAYLWGVVAVCVIMVIIFLVRLSILGSEVQGLTERNDRALVSLRDSVARAQADLAVAKELAPGLGEYMTTIQLHAGKLWFAVKASNWELAEYELDELKETMETAKALKAEKNGVQISNVLDSVLQAQVAELDKSIKNKNQSEFLKSYDETLNACNGCHTEVGYKFIHIVRPTAPPVTNQKWELSAK
ncbi:MAG TPA: hypothetical protein VGA09_11055 [Candidatus Binatia bacterium]